jgi:DnaJ family protein C protein 7
MFNHHFSDVLRSDNNNADALLVRGLCYYYQDNIDQAFRHFKQVLIMAPDHKKATEIFKVSLNRSQTLSDNLFDSDNFRRKPKDS